VITAADGADEISPAVDGKSLRVVWRRWALLGSKAGELVDPHINSEVSWHLSGTKLTRNETITATEAMTIRRWWIAVPSTAALSEWSVAGSGPMVNFIIDQDRAALSVSARADWPLKMSLQASGDQALGRGARGAIPLHLIYESRDLRLQPNRPKSWQLVVGLAPLVKTPE
jgi:hypothetical protein